MHIASDYTGAKSVKMIRIHRGFRRIRDWFYVLMLVFSICASSYVIYKKKDRLLSVAKFLIYIVHNVQYGINFIDNNLMDVKKVKINSLKYIPKEEVENIVKSSANIDETMSQMQLIKAEILKLPFTKSVAITRRPFRSLNINVQEVNIIAAMEGESGEMGYLIDDSGKYWSANNKNFSGYRFPTIRDLSIENLAIYQNLYQTLQNCPDVVSNIVKYENIANRRWNIALKNGTVIMLPAAITQYSMQLICDIAIKKLAITDSGSNIQYLDARVADRFYYKNRA